MTSRRTRRTRRRAQPRRSLARRLITSRWNAKARSTRPRATSSRLARRSRTLSRRTEPLTPELSRRLAGRHVGSGMSVAGWLLNPRERADPSRACHRGDGARADGNVGLAAFARTSSQGPSVMRPGVGGKVEQAGNSASLEAVARVGLIAYGVVHLLISWLALQLAWGAAARKSADPSGALRTVADQPVGRILLWLVALGSRSSSSQSQQQATSGVLGWPAGRVIVVVAGLIIVGVGVAGVVKGIQKSFSEELDTSSMSPAFREGVARLGQVGYIAKGVALGLVGGLLSYAALTFQQQKAPGLDGALQTILAQPFGRFLLTAVALGFLAFGLFAILQSRYRRM